MPDEKQSEETSVSPKKTRLGTASIIVGLVSTILGIFATTLPKLWHNLQRTEPGTFGNCALKPQRPPNIKRLNGYISEGQRNAKNKDYALAVHHFQQVIEEDANFLGVHENLGVVQLAQGDWENAQRNLEFEVHLIDCLRTVKKNELHHFDYFLNTDRIDKAWLTEVYCRRLKSAEDTAHYDLACVLAQRGEVVAALSELSQAAKYKSIKHATVANDLDLLPLRNNPGYESVVASFNP